MTNHPNMIKIMQIKKLIFISCLCSFFLMSNAFYGQSKSKEALGNTLVESIVNNDLNSFKSAVLPKEVVLELHEANDMEGVESKDRDSILAQYGAVYDENTIARYEKNFADLVALSETNQINWSDVAFMILYKYESKNEEYLPFLIHSKLKDPAYKHFYFEAVRYKGVWYLEGKMEVTKSEKYAPK